MEQTTTTTTKVLSQQEKFMNKLKELGITDYESLNYDTLLMVGIGCEAKNAISVGIDSHPREGIKDAALIFSKNGVIGDLQELDSQYIIDNFEALYKEASINS